MERLGLLAMHPRVYRTVKPHEVFEQHGGGTIRHEIYWSLYFLPDNRVGLFGSHVKNFFPPSFDGYFKLIGEITKSTSNYLEFYVFNPHTHLNIFYTAIIEDNMLRTQSFNENKPEEITEDLFEFVENPTDESSS